VVDGQLAAIGDTAFDAADRLAIVNLFGAYAYGQDERRWDEFRAVFTESPEFRYEAADGRVIEGIDFVISVTKARQEAFRAENIQRRHALNSSYFTSQGPSEASGICYGQVFGTRDGGPPIPDLTAYYEFTAVKQDGVWRLSRWIKHLDQANL